MVHCAAGVSLPLAVVMGSRSAQAATRFLNSSAADLAEVKEILNDIVKDNARAGEVISRLRALLKKTNAEFEPWISTRYLEK